MGFKGLAWRIVPCLYGPIHYMDPFTPFSNHGFYGDPNDLSASYPARKCPHRSLQNPSNRARPATGRDFSK